MYMDMEGLLRSFVVNSFDDQRKLSELFGKHFILGKPPNIVRMDFRKRFRDACPSDYLKVDNDVAFNYLLFHSEDMAWFEVPHPVCPGECVDRCALYFED